MNHESKEWCAVTLRIASQSLVIHGTVRLFGVAGLYPLGARQQPPYFLDLCLHDFFLGQSHARRVRVRTAVSAPLTCGVLFCR
jgi:hypothetical protein